MGKKKAKRGRPPFPDGVSRATTMTFRMQQEERAVIETAAKRDGQTLSDWIRATLLAAAKPDMVNNRGSE